MRVPKDHDQEGLSFNDLQRRAAKADSRGEKSSPLGNLGLGDLDLSKLDFEKLMDEALEVREGEGVCGKGGVGQCCSRLRHLVV